MNVLRTTLMAAGAIVLATGSVARAETTVTVKGTHLCCGACVKAVGSALAKVEGVSGKCDQKAGSVTITAKDDATAKKGLNALARAGFYGTTGNKSLQIRPRLRRFPEGKVERLELVGVHNCCGGCNRAIAKALEGVDGVEANTAKPKQKSFVVEGSFDARKLVAALQKIGFNVRPKPDGKKKAAKKAEEA